MIAKTNYELAKEFVYTQEYGKFLEMAKQVLEPDFEYEDLYRLMAKVYGNSGTPQFLSNMNLFFHMLHMMRSGDKIYHISSGLAARLAQTDVNVDSYFIKSPFREIYIQIDPGMFYIKDHFGKIAPVTGFYVHLKEYPDVKVLRVMASGSSKTPEGLDFGALFYMKMEFKEGKIRDQIKHYLKEHSLDTENLVRFGGNLNIDYWEPFVDFVLNTLLYITSKSPDFTDYQPIDVGKKLAGLKNVAKKRKFEQRMSKVSKLPVIVVGAGIADHENQMEAIQAAGGVGAWKLTKRVRVSGHWRAQRYGSAESPHYETIWINDYEKGPELADLLKKPYIVK